MKNEINKLKDIKLEDIRLNDQDIFNNKDLDILKGSYGLFDLGQLLAATEGFEKVKIFNFLEKGETKLRLLKDFVLGILLKEYREWKDMQPPPGCHFK